MSGNKSVIDCNLIVDDDFMNKDVSVAFLAYKEAKEAYLKELANKWKGKIDPRVYEALIGWEINIDD